MSNYFAALDVDDESGPKSKGAKVAEGSKTSAKPAVKADGKAPASTGNNNNRPATSAPAGGDDDANNADHAKRGGRPRGGGGRGAEKHREGWNGRGHEFDRHVAYNGRGRGTSKGGAGGGNWGSTRDVARQGSESETPADATVAAATDAPAAEPKVEEVPAEPEEVDTNITLDVYEQQRTAKREGALFQTVAVDNSALMKQFEKAKKHDRDADDEFADLYGKRGAKKNEAAEEEEAHQGPKAIDPSLLGFKVGSADARPPRDDRRGGRPGGDRPGRGRGGGAGAPRGARGGRGGRGGNRGGSRGSFNGPKVNVTDNSAFPALGSH